MNGPKLSRRNFLGSATGAVAVAVAGNPSALAKAVISERPFPKGFRWEVASSAHQIEGNNTNSDFWFLENIKPTAFAERSGDACDSYHRYEEDIALLARLGFNTYRFGVEWARIEPSRGFFSIAELDYYKRLVGFCCRLNIEPAVTFFHGTAPLWFAKAGGWLNPDSPDPFARYCSIVAKALASEIAFAFTINEPEVNQSFRSIPGSEAAFVRRDAADLAAHKAAALATNCERFVTTNYPDFVGMNPQMIAGHEKAFTAIKAERASLPVSVTLNITDFQPGTEDSPYENVRQTAYGEWLAETRKFADFAAVQVYRQFCFRQRKAVVGPRTSSVSRRRRSTGHVLPARSIAQCG
jgi:beta-glucosidase